MLEYKTLHSQIGSLLLEKLNLGVPSVDTDLVETGVLDSLAFVALLSHIEQEFEIEISIDDLEIDNFRSIAKIVDFITQRRESSASPRLGSS